MWPKYLAQIVVAGATAVGRALSRAVREEMMAGRQAASRQGEKSGGDGSSGSGNATNTRKRTAANLRHSMTLQEAMQILHVAEPIKPEEIEKRFAHLFNGNDKTKGGSFYIQEKIKSAKERIDDELKLRGQAQSDSASKEDARKEPPASGS